MGRTEFLDALKGGSDRVPMFLRDMTLGMDVLDVRTTDVFSENGFDAELSSDCIAAFQRMTGQDAVIGCTHSAAFLIEQFGGKMKYPEYGTPVPATHPLEGVKEFAGYDPVPKGKMLSALESYRLVKEKLPDTAVVLNVTGPLTKAGVLGSMEWLSMLIELDRDVLNRLLALCFENLSCVVERAASEGSCDAGILAAATDNPDLFGASVFREICVPWTKRYAEVFHKNGLPVIDHPHGTFVSGDVDLSEDILSSGCDGFHFPENNDPALLRERLGGKTCLLGGTDIVPTLLNGPEKKIVEETEAYLRTFSGCGYVFMPSCSLHRGLPLENIRLMCDTVKRFTTS
ncbi:MAG: hypothetical protein J6T68_04030 [Candidatus Methanomethylophilaceae archaeon]|nr:hypothetical protein [Candidatus Methanomethylophilaceae archaeon]